MFVFKSIAHHRERCLKSFFSILFIKWMNDVCLNSNNNNRFEWNKVALPNYTSILSGFSSRSLNRMSAPIGVYELGIVGYWPGYQGPKDRWKTIGLDILVNWLHLDRWTNVTLAPTVIILVYYLGDVTRNFNKARE